MAFDLCYFLFFFFCIFGFTLNFSYFQQKHHQEDKGKRLELPRQNAVAEESEMRELDSPRVSTNLKDYLTKHNSLKLNCIVVMPVIKNSD